MESAFQFSSRGNNLNPFPKVDIFAVYHKNRKPSAIYDIYMKVLQDLIPNTSVGDVLELFMSISSNANSGESRTNAVLGICALAFKNFIPVGRCEEVVDLLIKESHDSYESSCPEYHLVNDWGSLCEIALWGIKLIAEKGRLHVNQTEKVIDVVAGRVGDPHPHIRRNALSALTEMVAHCSNIPLSRVDQLQSIFHQHAMDDLPYIMEWSVQGLKELAKRDLLVDHLASEVLSLFLASITRSQHSAIRGHCILGLAALLSNQRVPQSMVDQCHSVLLFEAQSEPSDAVGSEAFVAIAQLLRVGTWGVERTDELVRLLVEKIECDPNGRAPDTTITVSACLLVVGELAARLVLDADTLGDLLLLLVAKASDSDRVVARNALLAINQCVAGRSLSSAHFAAIAQVMLDYAQQCDLESVDASSSEHSDVVTVALWGLGSLAECDALPRHLISQVATLLLRELGLAEPNARYRMLMGLMALVGADRLSLPLVDEVVDLMVALVEKSSGGFEGHRLHGSVLAVSGLSRSSSTSTMNGDVCGEEGGDAGGEEADRELLRAAIDTLRRLAEGDVLLRARQIRICQILAASQTTGLLAPPLHLVAHTNTHATHMSDSLPTVAPSPLESARVLLLSEEIAAMGEHLRALIAVHSSRGAGSEEARRILSQIESHLLKSELWHGKLKS